MPLNVYAIETADEVRRIVAAPSMTKAAILLNVTPHQLATYGSISTSDKENELALADPGAVWMLHPTQDEWQQLTSSRRARALPQHGGSRAGAGKHRIGEQLAKSRTIRLDDDDWASFREQGGTRFLRQVLALELSENDVRELAQLGGINWLRQQMKMARPGSKKAKARVTATTGPERTAKP